MHLSSFNSEDYNAFNIASFGEGYAHEHIHQTHIDGLLCSEYSYR
jgi:hypothetical protein